MSSTSNYVKDVSIINDSSNANISPIIYIQSALNTSSIDITELKNTLIQNSSSFSSPVINFSNIDITPFLTSPVDNISNISVVMILPGRNIPSSSLPTDPSTNIYLLGSSGSVDYIMDGIHQTITYGQGVITTNGVEVEIGSQFIFFGQPYILLGFGSILARKVYSSYNIPTRKIHIQPLSKKALRANIFPDAAMRTRAMAGREIVRSRQSDTKKTSSTYNIITMITAGRIYIQDKQI